MPNVGVSSLMTMPDNERDHVVPNLCWDRLRPIPSISSHVILHHHIGLLFSTKDPLTVSRSLNQHFTRRVLARTFAHPQPFPHQEWSQPTFAWHLDPQLITPVDSAKSKYCTAAIGDRKTILDWPERNGVTNSNSWLEIYIQYQGALGGGCIGLSQLAWDLSRWSVPLSRSKQGPRSWCIGPSWLYVAQLDMSTAFLNRKIDKVVHVWIPPTFKIQENNRKYYRLKKALYSLKQAGHL